MNDSETKMALHYLVREPKEKTEHPPLLLLLHGYGSNEHDLVDLADAVPPEFLVLSVRAPRVLGTGSFA